MIEFTVFTTTDGKTATKTVSVDKDGQLKKKSGIISAAIAERRSIQNIQEFSELLESLTPQQCLCYGVANNPLQKINAAKHLKPDEIARSKENFHWPNGAGILFIDCDKPDVQEEFLLDALYTAEPSLKQAPTLITRSTSHNLTFNGSEPTKGGYHLYFLIDDAKKIPDIGEAIYDRLWFNGHGSHEINNSVDYPAVLERCLIDKSVWQTNRIDYSALPVLKAGVEREHTPHTILNADNDPMPTAHFEYILKKERDSIAAIKEFSRNKVNLKVNKIREEIIDSAPDEEQSVIVKRFSLLSEHRLALDHEIHMADGSVTTVREIQEYPERYHQAVCLDPIEPEYHDYKEVAIIYTDEDMPIIHTLAHGGATYTCEMVFEDVVKVDFAKFFSAQKNVPKIEIKNKDGDKFKFGDWPKELRNWSGMIGKLLEASLKNSIMPSFSVSLVSAIQECAVPIGRDFRTAYNNYSNMSIVIVGMTGCGKDQIKKNSTALQNMIIDLNHNEANTVMSDVTSAGAILTALEEQPRRHLIADEFGQWIEPMSGGKGGGDSAKKGVAKSLMEIYSRVSDTVIQAQYSQKGIKKEDRVKAPDIKHPFICITGMTNPADMIDVVSDKLIRNGFINRCLFVFPPEGIRASNFVQQTAMPSEYRAWVETINSRVRDVNKWDGGFFRDKFDTMDNQIILGFSDEAKALLADFDKNYKEKRAKELLNTSFYELMPRVTELAMKLSLNIELSDNPMSNEISEHSFKKAADLVKFLKEEEIRFWQMHRHVNEEEKSKKELYNFIVNGNTNGVDKSTMKRRFQKYTGQKMDQMLTDLEQSGMIYKEALVSPNGGRAKTIYFAIKG